MKELREIIQAWQQLPPEEIAVLATLVRVEGSAYRRPGARMFITSKGQQVGTISGGCLESDVIQKAQQVIETGIPSLVKYDTTDEEDVVWGLGLGCQGIAYIFIEPLDCNVSNAIDMAQESLTAKEYSALATVFDTEEIELKKGSCLLRKPNGKTVSYLDSPALENLIKKDLELVLQQQKSTVKSYQLATGTATVFLEAIAPPLELTIFGAGFDVVPVVHFAKQLGWHVTVIDPLARSQSKARFKHSDVVILAEGEAFSQLNLSDRSVVIAMSHNYLYDLEFLQTVSQIPLKYLGILGPKKRTTRLLQDLQYEGFSLSDKQLHSPIGLDIGADNPEEIALSIIAEIKAVIGNRQGGFLKDRNAPIHGDKVEITTNA